MSTDGGIDNRVEKGVRILSLDSGGPGTYSQLLIIREYMVRLANDLGIDEADVYPADYFDLMGGAGFGGLVAILLGHLRMNVDEAIGALLDVSLAIFPDEARHNSDIETNTRQLRDSVENILQTRGISPDRKMQEKGEEPIGCKVALYAATKADPSHPNVLRTYKPRGSSLNPTIVEAICATIATPSYFSPIMIGPHRLQKFFIGGPRGAHNPTRELLKEASGIFGKETLLVQIISLGCGRSHVSSMEISTDTTGVNRLLQEMAADCDTVEKELATRFCDMDAYLRLNVDRCMDNLLMNEWNNLGSIETYTSAYAETAVVSETLEASLKRLQGSTGTVTLGQINHPSTAKDMQDKLEKHREDLYHAVKTAGDSAESHLLERLKPVDAPSYHEDHSCMEGTRMAILEEIIAWAATPSDVVTHSDDSTPNVFWLYGMPGLGKTSVANSLCDRLRRSGNLGGSFFCRHDNADLREPKRVLPTLIAKLVRMWGPFRELVAKVLLDEPQINPESTRGELLLKPLRALKKHPPHPLILVIDAIDECGQPRGRGPLLDSLIMACSLVNWLKVVITSRPEHDITSFFNTHLVRGRDLATDDLEGKDLRLFTKHRMAVIASGRHLQADWPGAQRINQIVERARGLFIFVDTLSRLVDVLTPEPLLVEVLSGKLEEEAYAELHKLYSMVIKSRVVRHTEEFNSILRAVVAVSAFRPLCAETLAHLIGVGIPTMLSWVDELSSLLYQDRAEKDGIRVRHLSILEFLVGSTCPQKFRVDQKLANSELARYCLVTMANKLQFNICELETSCLSNADIPDLDNRVEHRIPDALQYSCMHWSNHLCYDVNPVGVEFTGLLDDFFVGPQPLYWMEVLSLMGKVPVAILALRLMRARFKKFEDRHQRLVEDALRFLLAFFTPISTSTPHIYISALPFTPMESNVWKRTSVLFPEVINVCKGRTRSWPAPSSIWKGHTGTVHGVAYSPDGHNVVSGSDDKTIRIWDAQTGAAVGQPLTGHTGAIFSVAYSPDGRNIVSGSNDETIRIWDAQTGAGLGQPLTGHTGWVRSVSYSPDGRNVVSGSDDNTIRIWDAQTGETVSQPLIGHTGWVRSVAYSPDGHNVVLAYGTKIQILEAQTGAVVGQPLTGHTEGILSVAYSPDGQNIVSGSNDETIRIWDGQTGAGLGQPLTGHTGWVRSVSYSPDGRNVVSGSDDNTIRIWDAQTGAALGEPLRGHSGPVQSVSYSPDGRNIVSGSEDNVIRIWDAQTGAAVGQPLTGHTNELYSIAYSPDGQNIVSGSSDQTVRIWEAQNGGAVEQPVTRHAWLVYSVAYSPDGRNIVSGSSDSTIQIWDAQTGAAVGQPITEHTAPVHSVSYSPNGRNIVSGSDDRTIRIWDAQTGVAVGRPLRGHNEGVYSVAYSPNSQNIVSGSSDTTIRIWDAQRGAAVGRPLKGHTGAIFSVAYSPDGRRVVSGSSDTTIRIWSVQTRATMGRPLTGHTAWVWGVAYSTDGRNIVSGSNDSTIRIWDAQTGAAVGQPLTQHTAPVQSVSYSRDGRNIVSGSDDRTIRIWDAQTGATVGQPLTGHGHSVRTVAYSPDGQNVVSGSNDNTIRIWDAQTGVDEDRHDIVSHSGHPPTNHLPLAAFSGRAIPATRLDSQGWVRGEEGLLFWVPEDCRGGLTCPAILTIPHTGHQKPVRVDFTRFHYGTSWTNIRGRTREVDRRSASSL